MPEIVLDLRELALCKTNDESAFMSFSFSSRR
jgi:hypothetical protein